MDEGKELPEPTDWHSEETDLPRNLTGFGRVNGDPLGSVQDPEEEFEGAISEIVNAGRMRQTLFEIRKRRAEISGDLTPEIKHLLKSGMTAVENEEGQRWIDAMLDMSIPSDHILSIITQRDKLAEKDREGKEPEPPETPSTENLRARIKDQINIVNQSQFRLEKSKDALRRAGKLTPEVEKMMELADDASRDQAALDMLMALVEGQVGDESAGLVQEIFDEKQRRVDETKREVERRKRDK
jgi:hypothetical protein